MCKDTNQIAKNNIGSISYCQSCERIQMRLQYLVSFISYDLVKQLYQSLVDIKKKIEQFDNVNYNEKLLITSPIKDTYFSFTLNEVKEVLDLLEEALVILEVHQLLKQQ